MTSAWRDQSLNQFNGCVLEESLSKDYNFDLDNPHQWTNPEFEWEQNNKGKWEPAIQSMYTQDNLPTDAVSFVQSLYLHLVIHATNTIP